jgi:3-oxoacyl-[acyl-carrier-protein] synthase II
VVITGIGLATPIGSSLDLVSDALRAGRHGIVTMPEWEKVGQLQTRLAGAVRDVDLTRRWPRKKVRTMGRVALLATHATEQAAADAGLDEATLGSGRTGLAYGSTHGSSHELEQFCRTLFATESLQGLASSAYLKFMSHTTAANLALFFGVRGRVISTCAACVSASQAIGQGYELVRSGIQDVMICGGAEELHFVHAGVFDVMYATSTRYNDRPGESPRPFDAARDGMVVGEGAGTVVLESLARARARGARIHAEILGWGTNCDGAHVTSPSVEGMADCMRLALEDARVRPGEVGYVNAHATATTVGDVAESVATEQVLGREVPIASTKGYTGHTLGACGAIELAFCVAGMRDGFLAPNRNLRDVDPECAKLSYVTGEARAARTDVVMTNNFAFGGINTSIVIGRVGS